MKMQTEQTISNLYNCDIIDEKRSRIHCSVAHAHIHTHTYSYRWESVKVWGNRELHVGKNIFIGGDDDGR